MDRKIRIVMAKLGLDIHWRGVYLVSQFLKDAGMEVYGEKGAAAQDNSDKSHVTGNTGEIIK